MSDPSILAKRRMDRQKASEKLAQRLNESGIRRSENGSFSSIPFVPLINQKNYYTEYLRKDEQFRMVRNMRETVSENSRKRKAGEDEVENGRVIILHPGSETVKIGWSDDVDPKFFLNVVAHKNKDKEENASVDNVDPPIERSDQWSAFRKEILTSFKERMKYYKRKYQPNCNEQCLNYNKKNQFESVETDAVIAPAGDVVISDDVLQLKDLSNWTLRSPFISGSKSGFNDRDLSYYSKDDLLGDVEMLLRHAFKTFGLRSNGEFKNVKIIFIIPNIYTKAYVEYMVGLLIRLGFSGVAIMQESLAYSFGSGLSTACIVDIGAHSTSIACIDEGVVLEHSRVELDYGLDSVTRVWGKCLMDKEIGWKFNLNNLKDWWALRGVSVENSTFDDESVGVKTCGVTIDGKHWGFKVWDEVMTCPMSLFWPGIFTEDKSESFAFGNENGNAKVHPVTLGKLMPIKKIREEGLFDKETGIFEGYLNENPISALQELEKANLKISDLTDKDFEKLVMILTSVHYDNEPNTAGGGGAKKSKPSKFLEDSWLSERYRGDISLKEKAIADTSDLQMNMTPLDDAIIESITMSCEEGRAEKLWSSVCVVGGGGRLKNVDGMLIDRLHIRRNEMLGNDKLGECVTLVKGWRRSFEDDIKKKGKPATEFHLSSAQLDQLKQVWSTGSLCAIDVLGPSEFDAITLGWKGGCIYSKLRIIEEMWVSPMDWDLLGVRSIKYGSLFDY
ncbi:Arp8 protein [Martiniozyma asiatica (nom. inval.)]|nr:Arp8 protein [Martiniozyma asiatica]